MRILDDIKRRWGNKSDDITWLVTELEKALVGLKIIQSMLHNSGCPTNKCEGCETDAEEAASLAEKIREHINKEKEDGSSTLSG